MGKTNVLNRVFFVCKVACSRYNFCELIEWMDPQPLPLLLAFLVVVVVVVAAAA
jgi:hypothetical protein